MRQTTYTQVESTEFKMEAAGLGVWFGARLLACVCVQARVGMGAHVPPDMHNLKIQYEFSVV